VEDFLVIDLEATCYKRGTEPHGFLSEIIEIGAVMLDTGARVPRWEGDWIVRPRLNPVVSPFCSELTTLTQAEVDGGISLAQALDEMLARAGEGAWRFASWGFFDRGILEDNCRRYGIPYRMPRHFSLKHEFALYYNRHPIGMAGALKTLRIPLQGTHHRGIDDARNIAAIAARMLEDGWTPRYVTAQEFHLLKRRR